MLRYINKFLLFEKQTKENRAGMYFQEGKRGTFVQSVLDIDKDRE